MGKEMVNLSSIENRFWVYGISSYLEHLKCQPLCAYSEVSDEFITYIVINISNMLQCIPFQYWHFWKRKLGDICCVALLLCPKSQMNWREYAERYYSDVLNDHISEGKLYYRLAVIQKNNMESLVNLGKSVFSKNPVPFNSDQMESVINTIYQQAIAPEPNSGNDRNMYIIMEYIKQSKPLILQNNTYNETKANEALDYFSQTFGLENISSLSSNNLLTQEKFKENRSVLLYYFRHAPLFAQLHIFELVGFGNPKNPFSLLFKNENNINSSGEIIHKELSSIHFPKSFNEWLHSLDHINIVSIQCSAIVMRKFLNGPYLVALPYTIPWFNFLIAIGFKMEALNNSSFYKFWSVFIENIFPWNDILKFLNNLVSLMIDSYVSTPIIKFYCQLFNSMDFDKLLLYMHGSNILPELVCCKGSLWYDVLLSYVDKSTGSSKNIKNLDGFEDITNSIVEGMHFGNEDQCGDKFWKRVCSSVFLFKGMIRRFDNFVGITFCQNDINFEYQTAFDMLTNLSFKRISNDEINVDNISHIINEPKIKARYNKNKPLSPNLNSFDRNGDLNYAALYSPWNYRNVNNSDNIQSKEDKIFEYLKNSIFNLESKFGYKELTLDSNKRLTDTYFLIDATSWLRHFARIYKITKTNLLQIAICSTTIQELRFLMKSNSENIVEAATRAVIIVGQLSKENKLLILRSDFIYSNIKETEAEFPGDVNLRIQVNGNVIETISKLPNHENTQIMVKDIVLVTDDRKMTMKAHENEISTFSTRFVFSLTNLLSKHHPNRIALD